MKEFSIADAEWIVDDLGYIKMYGRCASQSEVRLKDIIRRCDELKAWAEAKLEERTNDHE